MEGRQLVIVALACLALITTNQKIMQTVRDGAFRDHRLSPPQVRE